MSWATDPEAGSRDVHPTQVPDPWRTCLQFVTVLGLILLTERYPERGVLFNPGWDT